MGNRVSSSPAPPQGPPALLSAAVMGDVTKFQACWQDARERLILDSQGNNVLHALFSCRTPTNQCGEILELIHKSLEESQLLTCYHAQNVLGCTPLWILVAYGNVSLLQEVQSKLQVENFSTMLLVPNHQGDSCMLATCSQGNLEMVKYLKQGCLTPDQVTTLLTQSNQKGTTPLQIVVGNGHLSLLEYFLNDKECYDPAILSSQLMEPNEAGLSLFHVCSERNFSDGLKLLLVHITSTSKSTNNNDNVNVNAFEQVLALKDKNHANALHVASYCGNLEAVQAWVDAVINNNSKDEEKNEQPSFLLDLMDGHARTAYWLAMIQGHDTIGEILAQSGVVDTQHPKMVAEIQATQQQRQEAAKKRQAKNRTMVDGNALIGK
jgi:ankyrin repeat protein